MRMSESEAIKILKVGFEIKELVPHLLPAYSTAIKALEEIQEYKEIEQKLKETYGDWVDLLNFGKAYIDWIIEKNNGVPHKYIHLTDDHVDMWNEYKSIGTVEEFKTLKHGAVYETARNKAIDDFMSLVNKKAECGSLDVGDYHDVTSEIVSILEEIAEQLKAGEIND